MSDLIKNLIAQIADKDFKGAQGTFEDVMTSKIGNTFDLEKVKLAGSIFNDIDVEDFVTESVDPEDEDDEDEDLEELDEVKYIGMGKHDTAKISGDKPKSEFHAKAMHASAMAGHDHHKYSGEIDKIAHHMKAGHDYKTARKKTMGEFKEENLSELSKKTLGSYVKKATSSVSSKSMQAGHNRGLEFHGNGSDAEKKLHHAAAARASAKSQKREKGIGRAVNRLTKEEADLQELSKKTLGSYVRKAADNVGSKGMEIGKKEADADEVDRITNRHMPDKHNVRDNLKKAMGADHKSIAAVRNKAGRRLQGIDRATARMEK